VGKTKIKRYILCVVCCWPCEVLEDAFLLVVEIFDGRDPLLAVAPQRGSPCAPSKGVARACVVWLERAAAGADGFLGEVGGVGLKAFEVRLKAPVAGPVCNELVQGASGEVELCGVVREPL